MSNEIILVSYVLNSDVTITCHSSCLTCDGPDSHDCVTCPDGTELKDDDNDGAGECVSSEEKGEQFCFFENNIKTYR